MDKEEYARVVKKIKESPGPYVLIKRLDMGRFPLVSLSNANNSTAGASPDQMPVDQMPVKKPAARPIAAKKKKPYVYIGYKKAKKRKLPKEIFDCKSCKLILENSTDLEVHENECDKILRETDCLRLSKDEFLQTFGLVSKAMLANNKEPLSYPDTLSSDNKIRRMTKFTVTSYFKSNPVPFSSMRGQAIALGSDFGKCLNKMASVKKYNKFCGVLEEASKIDGDEEIKEMEVEEKGKNKDKIKKKFEKDYYHLYAFTRRQKAIRKKELELGVKRVNWKKYKTCIPLKVSLKKLSEAEIAEITKPKQKEKTLKDLIANGEVLKIRKISIPLYHTSSFMGVVKLFM